MKITFMDECQVCDRNFALLETVYQVRGTGSVLCEGCVSQVYGLSRLPADPCIFLGEDAAEAGENLLRLLQAFKKSVPLPAWLPLKQRIYEET
jgi:hypothetical protein